MAMLTLRKEIPEGEPITVPVAVGAKARLLAGEDVEAPAATDLGK